MTAPVAPGPLFRSGWNPRGARRRWRRVSIAPETAMRALADLGWETVAAGGIAEAIGWFDTGRAFKMLFVRLNSGDDVKFRAGTTGYSIEFSAKRSLKVSPPAVQGAANGGAK